MSRETKVFYCVPSPSIVTADIEVYGLDGMGSFEWRVINRGETLFDTKDRGYGCAEIALRDGLLWDSVGRSQTQYRIKGGNGWWKPNAWGYTTEQADAGIYTASELPALSLDGCTLHRA